MYFCGMIAVGIAVSLGLVALWTRSNLKPVVSSSDDLSPLGRLTVLILVVMFMSVLIGSIAQAVSSTEGSKRVCVQQHGDWDSGVEECTFN